MIFTPHILYEDNHYIAISKPSGIAVQEEPESDEEAIIPLMQEYIGKRDKKPGKAFIGVMHRLDKLVTGVLILAKTSKGQERFNELLKNKQVKKYYLAITEKKKIPSNALLRHFLSRKNEDYRMTVNDSKKMPSDQEAILKYELIGMSDDSQCLAIELITGRRHQIRAQLAYIGCPIVGDKRYGGKKSLEEGLALHCSFMSFMHPIKNTLVVLKDNPSNITGVIWKEYKTKTQDWLKEIR